MTQEMAELKEACKPLMEYLSENHYPHTTVIVTNSSAELLSGEISLPYITDYVKD